MRVDDNCTISITENEYKELLYKSAILDALDNAGVDNWEGYSFALEDFPFEDYE